MQIPLFDEVFVGCQSVVYHSVHVLHKPSKVYVRTIILTLICHYSGMNGKVVFSIPFLLDQEVILLRHSLLMDQVPVFLPMEPRLAPYGRPL